MEQVIGLDNHSSLPLGVRVGRPGDEATENTSPLRLPKGFLENERISPTAFCSPGTLRQAAHRHAHQDVLAGPGSSFPQNLAASRGSLFFTADDGVHGRELWTTGTPATTLSAQGVSFTAREGQSFSGTVATFSDSAAPPGTFTAVIAWGDGLTSPGTVVSRGHGVYSVTGAHTYVHAGSYTAAVQITKLGGGSVTAQSSASVSDAPIYVNRTFLRTSVGRTFFPLMVATFVDTNPLAAAGDFTAVIAWGDGQTSTGLVAVNPHGGFTIRATHAYAAAGSFTATVTLTETGGGTAAAKSLILVNNPTHPAGQKGD